MDLSDFLFPTELRVTPSNIKRVLVIGSCLSEAYFGHFRLNAPNVAFDHLLFNNLSDLPDMPPHHPAEYDFIFVHLPLRYIVTDRIVAFSEFSSADGNRIITEHALDICALMLEACLKYTRQNSVLTFVSNFVVPQTPVVNALHRIGTAFDFSALVRRLNVVLAEAVSSVPNAIIADIETLAGAMGKRYFLDDYIAFYAHAAFWGPFHSEFDDSPKHNAVGRIESLPPIQSIYPLDEQTMFKGVWAMLESMYRTARQIDTVKLVIFDLDDTMWRGQIADHYNDDFAWPLGHGWPLGIWEAVQHLRARGILTAIASKNTHDVVRQRWDRAVPLPWVSLDDFLFIEINWAPKAESVARIIEQASLTPKSVLFVDDNPVERASVSAGLPGLRVIGSNPYVTKRLLLWSAETQIAFVSAETEAREDMIRRQQARHVERRAMSHEEFLTGLQARARVFTPGNGTPAFTRAVELLNKTNQFNTTGQRRSPAEVAAFLKDGGMLIAFEAWDKFTAYGLVGVVLLKAHHFAQFAMSCRVIGLGFEASVIAELVDQIRQQSPDTTVTAEMRETEANHVCRRLYLDLGFQPGSPQQLPHNSSPAAPTHVALAVESSEEWLVPERGTMG